ncbi:MAG: beta-ketoacyl synthase N-terminal-like domain-containing protein [Bacteroidota bacterium]
MGHLNDDGMKPVYILNDNIISSLGFMTAENVAAIEKGAIGIRLVDDPDLYPTPVQLSLVDTGELNKRFSALPELLKKNIPAGSFTRLEKFMILSVHEALAGMPVIPGDPRTLLVLSTTKGNINLLEARYQSSFSHKRLYLWELGRVIQQFFGFINPPVIISNACISGIVALMTASRFLKSGAYDHAVVTGGDINSEFVIAGFQSFQAISPIPCKPFDLNRTGLSLGEGCGTMVLSVVPGRGANPGITITGAAATNDANHISGPSRTGQELADAIGLAMQEASLTPKEIGFISAHGTATSFNDEMESKAFELAGLVQVPVNSFKGYWGHTLGAAGMIESIASVSSLKENILYPSAGFDTIGVPVPLNVIKSVTRGQINACLKTASGFGGCNAAITLQKV